MKSLEAELEKIAKSENNRFRLAGFLQKYTPYIEIISRALYQKLDNGDRERFLRWMLRRWAKFPGEVSDEIKKYRAFSAKLKSKSRERLTLDGKVYSLNKFETENRSFQLLAYDWFYGIHDIYLDQYVHKNFFWSEGDTIIDAGAFVGDTAIYFSRRLNGNCHFHCFEIMDENIKLFNFNLTINAGMLPKTLEINKLAISERCGDIVGVSSKMPQGSASIYSLLPGDGFVETITIDKYVDDRRLRRVDLIKMDIEGAELPALRGGIRTIIKHTPKLAICLYHRWDDVFRIPLALQETGVDYVFNFKWVEPVHGWEAVLLATPRCRLT